MADETNEGQASGAVETGSTAPDNTQQTTQTAASTQVAVPANNGWEAKEKAFIADLQKERRARQEYERQVTTHKAELDVERKRIQALTGVTPRTEQDDIRAQFRQVIPREQLLEHLGLTEEDITGFKESRQQARDLQETTSHYWNAHATSMHEQVAAEVAKELGGDTLSPRQAKLLETAYVQAARENPEFLGRHTKGDKTLVKEFAKDFVEDWIKPAQRKAQAASVGQNRPVPMGKDRTVTASSGKKIDVTDNKAVEDMLVESFQRRGGSFGR